MNRAMMGVRMPALTHQRVKRLTRLLAGTAMAVVLSVTQALAQPRPFDVLAQPATTGIPEFARQADVPILVSESLVRGKRTNAVVGQFEIHAALAKLLEGTGLSFRTGEGGTILVFAAADGAPTSTSAPQTGADRQSSNEQPSEEDERKVERVVVTGTHIRGKHPKSSPLDVYTARDIRRSGATTTEQFIQKLPQNSGTLTQNAPGSGNITNGTAISSVDLRGLGIGTTLVLVNGRRLALAGVSSQTIDVSLIPLSAIERVEVLTDGASAIYGSDAIGGVVNFILRDDIEGAETTATFGAVTDGGMRQGSFGQNFGAHWNSGHGLVAYNVYSASALEYSDRDYARGAGPGTLTPTDQRHNIFATVQQEVTTGLTLSADLGYAQRDVRTSFPAFTSQVVGRGDTEQVLLNGSAEYEVTDDLNASFFATYSTLDSHFPADVTTAGLTTRADGASEFSGLDLTAMLDGTLLTLPGGDVRFSFGGGRLDEHFSIVRPTPGPEFGRRTEYAFAELLVPLIASEQDFPLADRLQVSLAGRYTRFEDISQPSMDISTEDAISPKIGILWAPTESLALRGTYGTSFRAPSFTSHDPSGAFNILLSSTLYGSAADFPVLAAGGGSAILAPETASTYTLGFDLRPAESRFQLGATYFDISYEDKIGAGDPTGFAAILNPAAFPEIVFLSPTAAQIQEVLTNSTNFLNFTGIVVDFSDPAAAAAVLAGVPGLVLFDNRSRNLAAADIHGFDFSLKDGFESSWGDVSVGVSATYILDSIQQPTASAPTITVVDVVKNPVDLRARAYVSLSRGGFDTTLNINYVDDYLNPYALGGSQDIDSWTTFDWTVAYDFGTEEAGILSGVRLAFSAQNVFDEDPPFVATSIATNAGVITPVGFDSTNANPLGRFVTLGITKRW